MAVTPRDEILGLYQWVDFTDRLVHSSLLGKDVSWGHQSPETPSEDDLYGFAARLAKLEPLLVNMQEKVRLLKVIARPQWPFASFDKSLVCSIATCCIWPHLVRKKRFDRQRMYDAERRIRSLRAIVILNSGVSRHAIDLFAQAQAEVEEMKKLKRNFGGKCPVTSVLVTDICTYLFKCAVLCTRFNRASLYQYTGGLVTMISSPSCLLCSKQHLFSGWRQVRARDRYKNDIHRPQFICLEDSLAGQNSLG
jgi:hypothetical protein